jgi:hypothetical protein
MEGQIGSSGGHIWKEGAMMELEGKNAIVTGGTKGYMCPMGWECVTGSNVVGPDGVCMVRKA